MNTRTRTLAGVSQLFVNTIRPFGIDSNGELVLDDTVRVSLVDGTLRIEDKTSVNTVKRQLRGVKRAHRDIYAEKSNGDSKKRKRTVAATQKYCISLTDTSIGKIEVIGESNVDLDGDFMQRACRFAKLQLCANDDTTVRLKAAREQWSSMHVTASGVATVNLCGSKCDNAYVNARNGSVVDGLYVRGIACVDAHNDADVTVAASKRGDVIVAYNDVVVLQTGKE